MLPLKTSAPVALFGSGAEKTVKGGIGSGDVNNRENISVYKGIKEAGASVTNEDWIRDYDKRYKEAREEWKEKILEDARHVQNPFDAYAANPFVLPDGRRITEADLKGAGAAVYVISRISGEGKDRRLEEGDYYLSGREREDLLYLDRFPGNGKYRRCTQYFAAGSGRRTRRRRCTLRQGGARGETDGDVGKEICGLSVPGYIQLSKRGSGKRSIQRRNLCRISLL